MTHYTTIFNCIQDYLSNPASSERIQAVVRHGLATLPVLGEFLREDSPIEQTERLEVLYKTILRTQLAQPISGPHAREIARFQQQLGFILKYKPYAIKAATPLGYSIFVQNEREGFSFQRHVEHKLEVFHIIEVKPGGYVFLCDYQEWKRVYEKRSFDDWLSGKTNAVYDRYKFLPRAGDVFVISELGVVHTVVGCVLEEYATVSTDMVERLHDQNAGKGIPAVFNRVTTENILRDIEPPMHNRIVRGLENRNFETLEPAAIQGGERVVLCDSFVRAGRYRLRAGQETELGCESHRAIILRFSRGRGTVALCDASEMGDSQPCIEFSRSDLILIPPGIHYAVRNEGGDDAEYSEHCIAPGVAFV